MPEKTQNVEQRQNKTQSGGREGQPRSAPRGFAAMDPQRQRDIASEGGRAAHEQGKAHKFTPEEAREAGRKGGMASGAARASRSRARAAAAQVVQAVANHPGGLAAGPKQGQQAEPTTGTASGGEDEQKAEMNEEARPTLEDENRM